MRVGIDLGTTYCSIAYIDAATGKAKVINNKEGKPITPSVLYFAANGDILHGEGAKFFLEEGSELTASYFKYYMGDASYSIFRNGKEYSAIDLSAELLKGVVREAEDEVGENIYDVVITVPAYFDHIKRMATMEAGKKAGLNVLNIISEPTAAVFAYGIYGKEKNQTVLVYDLGGGTFDVTVAHITKDEIKILGTDGDHRLGGKDWDDALAAYLSNQFEEEFSIDLTSDHEMNTFLQDLAEKTKKQLTAKQSHKVTINYRGNKGEYVVTREIFDDITAFSLNRTKDIINKLLEELVTQGKLSHGWSDIDGVLLVGGSTRMQQVKRYITNMCGKEPMSGVNVDEAVALGAAIRANIDSEGSVQKELRFSIGGSTLAEPKYTIAGAKRIKDATAHSLGMIAESKDGKRFVNSIMIPKNAEIPANITKSYELKVSKRSENKQEVYMLQGEEENLTYPLNCSVLGKYVFTGIESVNSEKEQIDVTFSYDENNIVNISALQVKIGKKLNLHIEPVEDDMSWVVQPPSSRCRGGEIGQVSIMLAIDLSGSMSGIPLKKAKKAAISFVNEFDLDYTEIGLIIFANRSSLHQKLTHNKKCLISKINQWEIGRVGFGNSAQPFTDTYEIYENSENSARYLVVLTDGHWLGEEFAIQEAKRCHKKGIEIIALGFGDANKSFLDKIASRKGFASFTDLSNLESALTGIARII